MVFKVCSFIPPDAQSLEPAAPANCRLRIFLEFARVCAGNAQRLADFLRRPSRRHGVEAARSSAFEEGPAREIRVRNIENRERPGEPHGNVVGLSGPAEHIFVERQGRVEELEKHFDSVGQLEDLIQQIVSRVNRTVNLASPIADARLEDGSRVHVVLAPVALNGPILTIRKFPEPITMERLIELKSISREAAAFLQKAVERGLNIFISGGTGSGKTTILNAMSGYIPQEERVITIEDSAELQIRHVKNLVSLETRVENRDGSQEISMRDLIRASLRMRPDRIIVGEVRGGEALEMLQAMNTGHDGSLSTGHANSAKDMLSRLETMVLMAAELPLAAVRSQIGSALDLMVHVGRMRDRSRKVLEITEVIGYENGEIRLSPIYQFQESGEAGSGQVEGALVQVGRFEGRRRFAGGSAF